jgi:hypothetical protein
MVNGVTTAENHDGGEPRLRRTITAAKGFLFKKVPLAAVAVIRRYAHPPLWLSAVIMTLGFTPLSAAMSETGSQAPTTPAAQSTPNRSIHDLGLEASLGASILKGKPGVSLAVRAPVTGKLSVELGGILPHRVSDYASESFFQAGTPLSLTNSADVRSYAETHLAGFYRLARIEQVDLEAGLGVSLGFIGNRTTLTFSDGTAFTNNPTRTRLSPLIQLGARWHATERLTVSFDVAYVHYSNKESMSGREMDLDFGGVRFGPGVAWRF